MNRININWSDPFITVPKLNGIESIWFSFPFVCKVRNHFHSLMWLIFQRSELSLCSHTTRSIMKSWCGYFVILTTSNKIVIVLSSSPDYLIHFERIFFSVRYWTLWFSENNFFFFILFNNHISCLELWQRYHSFLIHKVWDSPLFLLLVPNRITDNHLKLIMTHQNIYDCLVLFKFLILETDSIQKLLLFIFMFILNIL